MPGPSRITDKPDESSCMASEPTLGLGRRYDIVRKKERRHRDTRDDTEEGAKRRRDRKIYADPISGGMRVITFSTS